jgi:hypothetical protein
MLSIFRTNSAEKMILIPLLRCKKILNFEGNSLTRSFVFGIVGRLTITKEVFIIFVKSLL